MTYFGDLKHVRASGTVTEGWLIFWCAICFVTGAAGAVVVLFSLSAGVM